MPTHPSKKNAGSPDSKAAAAAEKIKENKPPSAAGNAKPAALTIAQKIALVGAAAILALVLYVALIPQQQPAPVSQSTVNISKEEFANRFAYSGSIGVLMDMRGLSDVAHKQKVMQCGTDFAGSIAGSQLLWNKTLLVAACDNASYCIQSNSMTNVSSTTDFNGIIKALSGSTYIQVTGTDGAKEPDFYADRMVVSISPLANTPCKLAVNQEGGVFANSPVELPFIPGLTGSSTNNGNETNNDAGNGAETGSASAENSSSNGTISKIEN